MQAATESDIEVALLTGGGDRPYAFGLARALAAAGIRLDVIGGDNLTPEDFLDVQGVRLLHLRREPSPTAGLFRKAAGILLYYARLIRYAATAKPKLFHLLWNNKFETVDRVWRLHVVLPGARKTRRAHPAQRQHGRPRRDGHAVQPRNAAVSVSVVRSHLRAHREDEERGRGAVRRLGRGRDGDSVRHQQRGASDAGDAGGSQKPAGDRARREGDLFFGNIAPYKGLEDPLYAFGGRRRQTPRCG